ncbi:MAG: hypothetical protein ACREDR_05865 [Blastocatellia bacterium]
MKKALLAVAILTAFTPTSVTIYATQKAGPHDAEFRAFFAEFLKAVRANDKEKLADMIALPVADLSWYVITKGHDDAIGIKDKTEFLKKYDSLFTAHTRLRVLKAKTLLLEAGRYAASWDEDETEFTFLFEYVEGTGYRIESFTTGARR